jgi:hypothetical protein
VKELSQMALQNGIAHLREKSFQTVHDVLQLFVDALSTIDMMHSTAKGYSNDQKINFSSHNHYTTV